MSNIAVFSITSFNGSTLYNGNGLFNKDRVESISGEDGAVRLRYYRPQLRSAVRWDEFIVNETLSDVYDLLDDSEDLAVVLSVYDDQSAASGSVTAYHTNIKDIYYGVDFGTNSMLYVNTVGGVKKWICSTLVEAIIPIPTYEFTTFAYSGTQAELILRLPVGTAMHIYWGDGTMSSVVGEGETPLIATSSYTINGNYTIEFSDTYDELTLIDITSQPFTSDVETGEIVVSSLTDLTYLDISDTSLSGDIGNAGEGGGFRSLTALEALYGANTGLYGDVSGYSDLTSLTDINLENCGFETNRIYGDVSA